MNSWEACWLLFGVGFFTASFALLASDFKPSKRIAWLIATAALVLCGPLFLKAYVAAIG